AERQVEATREIGALARLPGALDTRAMSSQLLRGDLAGAAAGLAQAQAMLGTTTLNHHSAAGAYLAALRGNEAEASSASDQCGKSSEAEGSGRGIQNVQTAGAKLYNGVGRYDQALAAALDATRPPRHWGAHLAFPELVEAAVRSGNPAI